MTPEQKMCPHTHICVSLYESKMETYEFQDGEIIDNDEDQEPILQKEIELLCFDCKATWSFEDHINASEWIQRLHQTIWSTYYAARS